MGNLLQLQKGAKSFGTKKLFDEASFAVNDEEHVGVIGPNGAGKTTLFKILTDQEHLESGEIIKSKNLRLGYLAQHDQWADGETVEDYLNHGCVTPIWELKQLGRGLGITDEMFSRPIQSLSGGYRMRCKLLYLIGQEPNLMLLDEPTNYLDLETTLVLENFLQGFKGAFLLISHDREFLQRTTDHVLEIEQGEITKYNGSLDDYFEQKAMLRNQLETRALSLQQKRQAVLDFVARFGAKATKAKQAQSRLKSLDRMETIELKSLPVGASVRIPPPSRAGKIIATVKKAKLGYGEKVVLNDVDFTLNNGDHVAIVGLNGAGKSTFLKALAQVLKPLSGTVELGYQVSLGYYAQHVAEGLNPNDTVIDAMTSKAHAEVTRQEGLNMAGSLLFSGDDILKKVSVLSGGEKSRVALGQILLKRSPCLILDEPTNHLDFQTVEALTQSLSSYEGTLVVVSHDRSFIKRVGRKIVEINHGKVSLYPGSYEEYVWSLEKGILSERGTQVSAANGDSSAASTKGQNTNNISVNRDGRSTQPRQSVTVNFNYKEQKKMLDRQLRQFAKKIDELDKELASLQARLSPLNDQIITAAAADRNALINELGQLQKRIEVAEAEWLESLEKKERAETALAMLMEK
jgi:ATP-binding cassette, subfamily F, member 3